MKKVKKPEDKKTKTKENRKKIKAAIMRLFLKNILATLIENLNADNNEFLIQFLGYDEKNPENKLTKEIFE